MRKVIIVVFCILGMIVGVAIGESLTGVEMLKWLSIGGEFGIKPAMSIDLGFLSFSFGIWCKISIAGVLGMVVFAVISKYLTKWLKV